MSWKESLKHEIERQSEIHKAEMDRIGLSVLENRIMESRGVVSVPVSLANTRANASDVLDLIRALRKSFEAKVGGPVSVFIEESSDSAAA